MCILALACSVATAADSPVGGALLGAPYVDRSFGFSIRPPVGSAIYREKRFISTVDVELARFSHVEKNWHLSIRVTRTSRALDTQMIIEGIAEKLSRNEEFKQLRAEPGRVASRDAVRYAASFKANGVALLRQQAVISAEDTQHYNLIFITPEGDTAIVEPLFEQILGSFEIVRTEHRQKQLTEGLERGTALLQKVASGKPVLSDIAIDATYLRLLQHGKEVGFVEIRERGGYVDQIEGLIIVKNLWMFSEDDKPTLLRSEMFTSNDLVRERWDTRISSVVPAAETDKDTVVFSFESGFRQDDQLIVKYTPTPGKAEVSENVIEVEPSYAPGAWDLILPRVVDLKTEALYAFSWYDTGRRGLMMQTYRVDKPERLTVGGKTVSVIKLESSEGLIPPFNQVLVGEDGKVYRVSASPTELVPTTQQAIEKQYGVKVRAALARFERAVQSAGGRPPLLP